MTMGNVEHEKLGDDTKPVLYFKGAKKGLVLNKTNSNTIAGAYGDEPNDWFGQEVILFSAMVEFGGKSAPAIRVKIPYKRPKADPSGPKPTNPDLDDSIPF